jgi:serine/threonine protein kinase
MFRMQILIAKTGHIVLIDFGTAKDLNQTDLNGPDFVGTPDFMSPEAVKGTDDSLSGSDGVDHTVDLWALGAVAYQLYTGDPPFTSQSPYLTFLK